MIKYIFFALTFLFYSNLLSQELFLKDIICTDANEYGLCFITDNLLCFTRSQNGIKTLMLSEKENGEWQNPYEAPFNGRWNNEYARYDKKSGSLVFSSTRPRPGTDVELQSNDIWVVYFKNNVFSDPAFLGSIVNHDGIDSGGCIHNDTLYFHSDREGRGMNDVDIYMFDGEDVSKLNISSPVVDGEIFFYDNGNRILFMSSDYGSKGFSDIFYAVRNGKMWSQPTSIDLSGKVNTEAWEYTPSLSLDEQELYFTRIVDGQADVYMVKLKDLDSIH